MNIIGGFFWAIGMLMSGAESNGFSVNIIGLVIFIAGNLTIYKEYENGKHPKR